MNNNNAELAARHLDDSEYKIKKLNGPNSSLRIIACVDPTDGEERYLIRYKDRENKNTLTESGRITLTDGVGDHAIKLEDCIGEKAIISVSITGAQ